MDIRFAFETLQRAMPSARALLVASLLTEPPYGVSALRVTIAIASDRLARKQRALRKSTAKVAATLSQWISTRRHARAGAVGWFTAMTRTAFCRKSPQVQSVCSLRSCAIGT